MKHFFLFVFLLFATALSAQNKINIGVQGGLGLIKIYGNPTAKIDQAFDRGYTAGLSVQYNFKKIFSLRSGLSFERKGSASHITGTDPNAAYLYEIKQHLFFDYLTLPVLVRASFGKKVNFFVNAGPYFGYLIQTTFIYDDPVDGKLQANDLNLIRKFDWGLAAGLGIAIPIKKKLLLSFELRNNVGLYDIAILPFWGGTMKTYSANLLVGVAYTLGKTENTED
ncbi:MAG TPA: porin family protein [Bacteroidia bacterium]|jgi:hypothetical protein|nr:porin family protein [Bacteroidia bacterium]